MRVVGVSCLARWGCASEILYFRSCDHNKHQDCVCMMQCLLGLGQEEGGNVAGLPLGSQEHFTSPLPPCCPSRVFLAGPHHAQA